MQPTQSKSNNCKHKRKCKKCVCECPPQPICPPCPSCPTCPQMQFGANSGEGSIFLQAGDKVRLLAIGGGGGGGGSNIGTMSVPYTGGAGGGRGQYQMLDFTAPNPGTLLYFVGQGGAGGIGHNGVDGTSSSILFLPIQATAPITLAFGLGGKGGGSTLDGYSNGGNDGGGGAFGYNRFNQVIYGTGGVAGQGSAGQNAYLQVISPIAGAGGDGTELSNSGFTFLSDVVGAGGVVQPGSFANGGGGAGGVGATDPNIKGEDGNNNGGGGGIGWGAGGGGASLEALGIGSGGAGAMGAIGILYI